MLGGFAARAAHGNFFYLAPLGEVGKFGRGEVSGDRSSLRRGRRGGDGFSVGFNVVVADEPAGAGAFDVVDVDAEFAGEPADMRSGGNGRTMFRAGNFSQLQRHAE